MTRFTTLVPLIGAAALGLALLSCDGGDGESETNATGGDTSDCEGDEVWASPGCQPPPDDSYASPTAGCYQTCAGESDDSCAAGTCTRAWIEDICPCPPSAEACCEACGGGEQWLCM